LGRTLRVNRRIVYKHVDRAQAAGVAVALRERSHGSAPTITAEIKVWIPVLAYTQPKKHGQVADPWTLAALTKHIYRTAVIARHRPLSGGVKSTGHLILREAPLPLHKIK
jgi:hypothetical protein